MKRHRFMLVGAMSPRGDIESAWTRSPDDPSALVLLPTNRRS